ncbi:MAG: hypothetical protein P1U40_14385 [Coxiellaceae bacterium]|nr:hypothetical protein [Coxiellaceae bacterium]
MRRRTARPAALESNVSNDPSTTFEMVEMGTGGAAASAADVPEEVVLTAPALSAAELAAAALGNLGACGLKKGQRGWIQFQFTSVAAAQDFVSTNDLHSERPGQTSIPKGVDENRIAGLFTVRTSPALYVLLQSKTHGLPDYADVEAAPTYRR